jgi:hypothetical protein
VFIKPCKNQRPKYLKLLGSKIDKFPFIKVIFNKWIMPSGFYLRDILEFLQISGYTSYRYIVEKFKYGWDRTLDESRFPEFLTIHQSISKLACAYSLGKIVERASMKGKKI